MTTYELEPQLESVPTGEADMIPANSIGSKKIFDGPTTPSRLLGFLRSIRKHETGPIDQSHPLISHVMERARTEKLDVVITADGNGFHAVTGKNIVPDKIEKDSKRMKRIAAGVVISAAVVAGIAGFVIRRHKR